MRLILSGSMPQRLMLKYRTFQRICRDLSELSHDDKVKVGSIIITPDFREICSMGYNGSYKGGPNQRDSMEVGKSGFIHAEENALIHLCKQFELRSSLIMISTHKPCPECAKRIVNGGIRRVIYEEEYDSLGPGTDSVFFGAGVDCQRLPPG